MYTVSHLYCYFFVYCFSPNLQKRLMLVPMFVLMFVHVVSSINAAHEGVVTGHWIWMVTCTLRTRHSEPEPTLISSSSLALAWLWAGRWPRSGRGLWPGSPGAAPGTGPVLRVTRPGVPGLEWPPPATTCPSVSVQTRAAQCQHRGPPARGQHDTEAAVQYVVWWYFIDLVWGEWQWFLVSRDPNFFFWIHEYIFYHWRKTENKLSLLPIQKNIFPRIFYIISRSWH